MFDRNNVGFIENGRAKFAYDIADKIDDNLKDSFKSHVKSFPMLVKKNGLAAAISFLFSKKNKEKGVYKKVGNSIVEWLKEDGKYNYYNLENLTDLKSLSKQIVQIDSSSYRALTIEIFAYFKWLRRFAEGLS